MPTPPVQSPVPASPAPPAVAERSIGRLVGLIAGSAAAVVIALGLTLGHGLPLLVIFAIGAIVPITCLALIVREVAKLLQEGSEDDPTSF